MTAPAAADVPLDQHFAARGAPPGSMRWHALLYAPERFRDRVAAALALEAELRDAGGGDVEHAVAHAKLGWWREETARLAVGEPRHPLTVALLAAGGAAPSDLAAAVALAVGAAEVELAQVVLQDEAEFDRYLLGSGAAFAALALGAATRSTDAAARFAAGCGRAIRLVEIVRDLRRDAWRGRVFAPWNWVEEAGLRLEDLRSGVPGEGTRLLGARLCATARRHWQEARAEPDGALPEAWRPLCVLAELHLALLADMERDGFAVAREPAEIAPLRRTYLAWRAARRARSGRTHP
jgi:phytoene synthase